MIRMDHLKKMSIFNFFLVSLDFSLWGSFLTKTNVFFIRLKISWVDPHVPTIILVYGNIFTLYMGHGTLNIVLKVFSTIWVEIISWEKFINCVTFCQFLRFSTIEMGHPKTPKKYPVDNWVNESHTIAKIYLLCSIMSFAKVLKNRQKTVSNQ